MEWISIREKRPYYGERVLIKTATRTEIGKYLDLKTFAHVKERAKFSSFNTDHQKFFIKNNHGIWSNVFVTEWAKLN